MRDFFHHNGILVLIIAVLLALITVVLSLLPGGRANPAANLVGVVVTPVRDGIHAVVSWVERVYSNAFEQDQKDAELEALRQELAQIRSKLREAEAIKEENEFLHSALDLREKREEYQLELASVTAYGPSNWSKISFT